MCPAWAEHGLPVLTGLRRAGPKLPSKAPKLQALEEGGEKEGGREEEKEKGGGAAEKEQLKQKSNNKP